MRLLIPAILSAMVFIFAGLYSATADTVLSSQDAFQGA